MLEPLNNAQIRKFKAAAQLMDASLKVGKAGLSDGFIRTVSAELDRHELVKIKFAEFKEEKKTLEPLLDVARPPRDLRARTRGQGIEPRLRHQRRQLARLRLRVEMRANHAAFQACMAGPCRRLDELLE